MGAAGMERAKLRLHHRDPATALKTDFLLSLGVAIQNNLALALSKQKEIGPALVINSTPSQLLQL
jgi:hypothetical protein